MFIQEKNIFLPDKEKIENNFLLESCNILNKKCFSFNLDSKPNTLPLRMNDFNLINHESITLEEIKNIMNETKINLEEDECEDIYFIKNPKMELQSTDASTKIMTIPENKEESFSKTVNFKVTLNQKRGRKAKEGRKKLNQRIHGSTDFDNIQRKIQVNFITFLIRLGNDALKTIFGKKTKFHFKDVKYELKKIVNHNYIEHLKQCNYSDIIKMKISPKNKRFGEDENKRTFTEICKYSDKLKNLFNKNYLYLFQKYYCNLKNGENFDLDGIKVTLSPKTKTLFNLLKKNEANKEKFNNVIQDVYFSEYNYNSDKKFIISSGN